MDVTGVTPHPFRMTARVPDGMVSLEAGGEWAAWSGVDRCADGGRESIVLVSIAVTAFHPAPGTAAGDVLRAALQSRHPAAHGVVDEFAAADGSPALRVRGEVRQRLRGRTVRTGQAQALVAFPGAGALGVVSAVCPDLADLDRAAELVGAITAQMTVTAAPAAA
jgi:hypothetical protein